MNQRDLNRSVARATGEEVSTIEGLGFSVHRPGYTGLNDDLPVIDWDALELRRTSLFPDRQKRHAVA